MFIYFFASFRTQLLDNFDTAQNMNTLTCWKATESLYIIVDDRDNGVEVEDCIMDDVGDMDDRVDDTVNKIGDTDDDDKIDGCDVDDNAIFGRAVVDIELIILFNFSLLRSVVGPCSKSVSLIERCVAGLGSLSLNRSDKFPWRELFVVAAAIVVVVVDLFLYTCVRFI